MKIKYLVVDTAAFVKNVPIWEIGEELFSVPEVFYEIRDPQTRDRIQALPVTIAMRQPQPQSIKFINDFSRKTGDYASLSLTDVKILALTYELELEAKGGADHLRNEPEKSTEVILVKKCKKIENPTYIEGFYLPPKQDELALIESEKNLYEALNIEKISLCDETTTNLETQDIIDVNTNNEINDTENETYSVEEGIIENEDNEEEINEEEEDDDEGWITPSNIKKHQENKHETFPIEEEDKELIETACITSDFAMQNVLKHIGLHIIGVDGKLIRQVRTHIFRCHACYKTTSVMTKVFCPHCGNKTLKKVAVTLNPDGSKKIWISARKPISVRGTKFSLPMPKGGKHAINPILVEDQKEAQKLASKLARKKLNPFHEDYDATTPFALRDIYSRASQLGYLGAKSHTNFYWEQRNPNVSMKKISKKKK